MRTVQVIATPWAPYSVTFDTAPVALMTAGLAMASPLVLSIAMIWLAHIGIDRALGYGLKYSAGFGFTHLGRIGRQRDA